MKSYIDLEQSKKLAEILPIESADFFWLIGRLHTDGPRYQVIRTRNEVSEPETCWPCWSLAALLDVLPEDIIVLGTIYSINIHTKNKKWFINYKCNNEEFIGAYSNIFVDACYEMILKLHEQKIL